MNIPKLLQQAGSYLNEGNAKSADMVLARILKKQPQHVDALNLAGLSAYHRKRFERADRLLRKVIFQQPGRASAHLNLGAVLNTTNQFDEAANHYRAALEIEPNNAIAMCNLGKNFLDQNATAEAKHWLEASLNASPDYWVARHNLGTCLQRLGATDEAIDAYRRTLQLHDNPLTLSELIVTLRESEKFNEEYALANRLLAMDNIGDVAISAWETLFDAFDWDAINRSTPRILALLDEPTGRTQCKSRALLLLNSLPDISAQTTYNCHRAWAQSLPGTAETRATNSTRKKFNSRLRIAYISPDFREHSVGYFCQHLVCGHDVDRFDVYCYANSAAEDSVTKRIRGSVAHYINVSQMSDVKLQSQIKNDGIDILVDLAGHTRDSRIAIFATRLAPLQMTYLGYPNTSGLDHIDYRISDPYADTDDGTHYSEELLRLPESFLCFGDFEHVARRTSSPADDASQITFGSFNNIRKINPPVVKLWSEILNTVQGSRLILKSRRAAESITAGNLKTMFESNGIDPDRIEFIAPTATRSEHLSLYNSIDIALDTFPYHGTTTTCEALWMGVPVITLVGDVHAQRVSYSILKNLGLDELIGYTGDQYVQLASSVSRDRDRLNELRTEIPERLNSSILCDVDRFVGQFEQALLNCVGDSD